MTKAITRISKGDLNMEVQIDEHVYQKIMHWVKKAGTYEVSGLGNVILDKENGVLRVTEAYLLEQKNEATETEISAEAIGKLEHDHFRSKIEGDLRFWWHSHASMGVFWSGTDYDTIHQLGQGGWMLNTVFNNKEELRTALVMTDPVKIFADELDTSIICNVTDEKIKKGLIEMGLDVKMGKMADLRWLLEPKLHKQLTDQWDKEYEDKVTEVSYTKTYGNGYADNYAGGWAKGKVWCSDTNDWQWPYLANKIKETAAEKHTKESFPDYDPKKKASVDDPVGSWLGEETAITLNVSDKDDHSIATKLNEIDMMRYTFDDEEIEEFYLGEILNIKEVLKHLDEEEENTYGSW